MVSLDGLSVSQRYILGLLAESDEPLSDHLMLQKEVFLLSQASEKLAAACQFTPHFKGPFSEEVESALQDLHDVGMVSYRAPFKADIHLKPAFRDEVRHWWHANAPPHVVESTRATAAFAQGLTQDEMLLCVYSDHPTMTVESVVRPQVEARRVPNAVSLYRKGKVTLNRAAELSGMNHLAFKRMLADRGHLRDEEPAVARKPFNAKGLA